jgi:hypothetical protein
MTNYRTDYFYEKLKNLAKVNEEARNLLLWYEDE